MPCDPVLWYCSLERVPQHKAVRSHSQLQGMGPVCPSRFSAWPFLLRSEGAANVELDELSAARNYGTRTTKTTGSPFLALRLNWRDSIRCRIRAEAGVGISALCPPRRHRAGCGYHGGSTAARSCRRGAARSIPTGRGTLCTSEPGPTSQPSTHPPRHPQDPFVTSRPQNWTKKKKDSCVRKTPTPPRCS